MNDHRLESERALLDWLSSHPDQVSEALRVLVTPGWASAGHRQRFRSLCKATQAAEARPLSAQTTALLRDVRRTWARYRAASLASALSKAAHADDDDLESELERIVGELVSLDIPSVAERIPAAEHLRREPACFMGLFGWSHAVDAMGRGELWVLGARPAMGKTALAMFAVSNALGAGARVLVFGDRGSTLSVQDRILHARARVPLRVRRSGQLTAHDEVSLEAARQGLAAEHLRVEDAPWPSLAEICARARRVKEEQGLDLVVVDGLSPMLQGHRDGASRIAAGLKSLARRLDVAVLVTHELTRAVEHRRCKMPRPSDLRHRRALLAQADRLVLFYRPAYYEPETYEDHARVSVWASGRNSFYTHLDFDGACCRFSVPSQPQVVYDA